MSPNSFDNAATKATKWVIVLIAFDDDDVPAQVIKERVAIDENEQLAALLRGGELLDVLPGTEDEATAELYRLQIEKQCLR
jgi:hypothetical protein